MTICEDERKLLFRFMINQWEKRAILGGENVILKTSGE